MQFRPGGYTAEISLNFLALGVYQARRQDRRLVRHCLATVPLSPPPTFACASGGQAPKTLR